VASILVDLEPIKTTLSSPILRVVIKSAALLLAASPGIVSFARAELRAEQGLAEKSAKEGIAELQNILVSAISILFDDEPMNHIRANVMLRIGDRLKMFCSANMAVFPDYQMELSKSQGCAGVAWERAVTVPISECWKPVFAPKTQLTTRQLRSRWKLSAEQIGMTSHILWVLSVPIFGNVRGRREFLGVLNLDGVVAELRHPDVIGKKEFIGSCVKVGERIADHLLTECKAVLVRLDSRFSEK
jgi:hypothetical protein